MKIKCRWCEWINGMWKCTNPYNKMFASEFCSWNDEKNAIKDGKAYCPDYEPEYEDEYKYYEYEKRFEERLKQRK